MEQFIEFISKILEIDRSRIKPDTGYGSIPQWDSLMHLRLVAEIEEQYGAEIPLDEVPDIKTIADFYKYVY